MKWKWMGCGRAMTFVIFLMILTGCWDRVEVNDRAFVTAVYIDVHDNGEYEVSLGFPLPNRLTAGSGQPTGGGGGEKNPFTIVTKTAENIPEAVRKIRSDLSREITWGHNRVIVFGQKMAERGIGPMLELAAREPTFHIKTYIMVAPGKAKDASYLTPVFEKLPTEVLREFANRKVIPDTTVKDALDSIEFGGDFVTGLLTKGNINMLSEQGKKSPWVGTDGAAVFRNGKMVGEFDVKDMRSVMWLQGKMKNALISIKAKKDGKPISFLILNSRAKVTPKVKGEQISFDVRIEAEDDVNSSESTVDLTDPTELKDMQQQLSKVLTERVEHALKHSQQLGVDAFQLGRYVEWRYPSTWRRMKDRWREVYKTVEFDVHSQISIKRLGTEKNPIWINQQIKEGR